MAMPPRVSFDRGKGLKRAAQQKKMPGADHVFRDSSREVVDGSMLILPRASFETGKDLKCTARQKYHEPITMFRNSSRCAVDGPMVIRPRAS